MEAGSHSHATGAQNVDRDDLYPPELGPLGWGCTPESGPSGADRHEPAFRDGAILSRMLIVDAANVIGSRPTGWWRDRPGAARRFAEHVRRSVREGRLESPVVLVFEGQARKGADQGKTEGVEVVHATGEGDDTIVAMGESHPGVVVVTADRELVERVRAVGGDVRGPSWLLDRLGPESVD